MEYTGLNYTSKYKDVPRLQNSQKESYPSEDGNLRSEYSRISPSGNMKEQTFQEQQSDDSQKPIFQRNLFKLLYGNQVGQYQKYNLNDHEYEKTGLTDVKDGFYVDKTYTGSPRDTSFEAPDAQSSARQETPTSDKVDPGYNTPYRSPLIAGRTSPVPPYSKTSSRTVGVQTPPSFDNRLSEDERKRLDDAIAGLRQLLADREGDIHDLQKQMLDLRDKNRSLKDEIDHVKRNSVPNTTAADEERKRLEDMIAGLRQLLAGREGDIHDLQKQMLDLRDKNRSLKDETDHMKSNSVPNTTAADYERKLTQLANEKDIMASKVARLNDEIQYLKNKQNRNREDNPTDINALLKKIADLESANGILTEANEVAASELVRRDKRLSDLLEDKDRHKHHIHGLHDDRYCPYKYKIQNSSIPNGETYQMSPNGENYKSQSYRSPKLESYKTPNLDSYKSPNIENYKSPNLESYRSPNLESYKIPNLDSYRSPNIENYKSPDLESYRSPSNIENYKSPDLESYSSLTNRDSYKVPLNGELYKSRYSEKYHHNGYSRDLEERVVKTPTNYSRDRKETIQDGNQPGNTTEETEIRGLPYRSRSVQSLNDLPYPSGVDRNYTSTFPELSKYASLNAGGDYIPRRKYGDDIGEISDTPTDILLNTDPMDRLLSRSKTPQWKTHTSIGSDSSVSDEDDGYHTIYRKRSKSVLGRGRFDDALQTTPVETGPHRLTTIRPSASMEGLAPLNHRLTPHPSTAGYRSVLPKPLITQQNKHVYTSTSSTGSINLSNSVTHGMKPFSPSSPADIQTNDIIKFSRQGGKLSMGCVRFIGNLPGRSGVYLGVELFSEEGKHDGTYGDVRYFKCKPNKGVFVAFNKVVMAWTSY